MTITASFDIFRRINNKQHFFSSTISRMAYPNLEDDGFHTFVMNIASSVGALLF